MVEAAPQALPLLRERVQPVRDDGIVRWIADLDADDYERRQTAQRELERHEFAAEPALRNRLKNPPSLEQRRRVERLLKKLDEPMANPDVLRAGGASRSWSKSAATTPGDSWSGWRKEVRMPD